MTILEEYRGMLGHFKTVPYEHAFKKNAETVQELHYRIYVLEELRFLSGLLLKIKSDEEIRIHFVFLLKCFERMKTEFNKVSDGAENSEKQNTAKESLCVVVSDFRKRMMQMSSVNAGIYTDMVKSAINSVIAVWLVYRDTLTKIINNTEDRCDE